MPKGRSWDRLGQRRGATTLGGHSAFGLHGYQVISRLRRGHALDVWDAWSWDRGCRCILKTVRPERAEDDEVRAEFQQEAELLVTLAHPHLVRGYEYVMGERPVLAMETLSGHTLGSLIEEQPLLPNEAAEMGLQIGSALRYLHRHNTLHLDVKPDNLVAEAGKAKVIDLSLARPPGAIARGLGTWCYLAPEQALGEPLTTAADVWGLGVTLYEALSGDDAFDGPEKYPQLHRPPPDLSSRCDAPREFVRLINACLLTDPIIRPSMDEVLCRLELLARVPRRDRRWSRGRHR